MGIDEMIDVVAAGFAVLKRRRAERRAATLRWSLLALGGSVCTKARAERECEELAAPYRYAFDGAIQPGTIVSVPPGQAIHYTGGFEDRAHGPCPCGFGWRSRVVPCIACGKRGP